MNVIFGSGLIGLLAKAILGPSWTIVPFYKSRFFSFNPALDDNFIICDDRIDSFLKDLTQSPTIQTYLYQRSWSVIGQIEKSFKNELCVAWLYKLFGSNVPPHAQVYLKDRMQQLVYDLRANQLYQSLLQQNIAELKNESLLGQVTDIGNHYFVRDGKTYEFDNAVSTIPLDALHHRLRIANWMPSKLLGKTIHYWHVETTDLNFEGSNQLMVVDHQINFFKVTQVAPNRYLFYCHEEVPNPGIYLMNFMKDFDIIDGTSIEGAIPLGPAPNLDHIEKLGIYCIGSSAQQDWCMDIGSCIIRLLKYSQRDFKTPGMVKHDLS